MIPTKVYIAGLTMAPSGGMPSEGAIVIGRCGLPDAKPFFAILSMLEMVR